MATLTIEIGLDAMTPDAKDRMIAPKITVQASKVIWTR